MRSLLLAVASQVYGFHLRTTDLGVTPQNATAIIYHDKDEAAEMDTSVSCCLYLALTYFFVYTFRAIILTCREINVGRTPSARGTLDELDRALKSASYCVNAAPMIALLIVILQMRAVSLGVQQTDTVQLFMKIATYGCQIQTLLVLLIPVVTGKILVGDRASGFTGQTGTAGWRSMLISACRFLGLLTVYCGVGGLVFSIFTEEQVEGRPIPPAIYCISGLCIVYFLIGLLYAATEHAAIRFRHALHAAYSVVGMTPMLGALFMAARLRALQVVPSGNPQHWAQMCFYAATAALLAQVILAILCSVLGGTPNPARPDVDPELDFGDSDFQINNMSRFYFPLAMGRFLAMGTMYGCVGAIIYSIVSLEHDSNPVPLLAPAILNTFALAGAFFLVYLAVYVLNTVRDVVTYKRSGGDQANPLIRGAAQNGNDSDVVTQQTMETLENARIMVQFCPMLAIMFLTIRLRALQVTDMHGGPQLWAQSAMWICTASILAQLLFVCLAGSFTQTLENMQHGTVGMGLKGSPWPTWLKLLRYVALLGLYCALLMILSSAFLLTPETASPIEIAMA